MPGSQVVGRSIAVVGCGHWGPNHIRVFSALPGVTVGWAVDIDPDRLRHAASMFPTTRCTSRYEDVLGDPSVDAVVLSTPAATHATLALAALRAGKHVLCEKPLCRTSRECDILVATAAAHGVVLMAGHVFLFNPGILEIKRFLDLEALGRIRYASAERASPGPVRQDVDVAWDLASHEIAIFNFLFSSLPLSISATGRAFTRPDLADTAAITLNYPDDVMVNVRVSWLNPSKIRLLSIVGDTGMATFNDLGPQQVTVHRPPVHGPVEPYYDSYAEFQELATSASSTQPAVARVEPLREQARHFIDAISMGHAGRADGVKGSDVVEVLEAISESMRHHGAAVVMARRARLLATA
jgi:predicted dehydrogenase